MSGADTIPEGWQLGDESWSFHRQFYVHLGRTTRHAEYAGIIAQIRYRIAEPLDRHHFRVTLSDGSPLIVRGNWHRLSGIKPPDWTPKPGTAVPKPARVAEPPPPKPLRASTLTLGNPALMRAAAERLRRFGVPIPGSSHASPP